jgi:hypothetical protein
MKAPKFKNIIFGFELSVNCDDNKKIYIQILNMNNFTSFYNEAHNMKIPISVRK